MSDYRYCAYGMNVERAVRVTSRETKGSCLRSEIFRHGFVDGCCGRPPPVPVKATEGVTNGGCGGHRTEEVRRQEVKMIRYRSK